MDSQGIPNSLPFRSLVCPVCTSIQSTWFLPLLEEAYEGKFFHLLPVHQNTEPRKQKKLRDGMTGGSLETFFFSLLFVSCMFFRWVHFDKFLLASIVLILLSERFHVCHHGSRNLFLVLPICNQKGFWSTKHLNPWNKKWHYLLQRTQITLCLCVCGGGQEGEGWNDLL